MRKKILYILLEIFLFITILLNYIAYNDAYKFTHFAKVKESTIKISDTSPINLRQKLKYILFGVDVPRPENNLKPSFDYETVIIPTQKGKLELWVSDKQDTIGTVILFHGYANKKSSLKSRAAEFFKLGYNVVMVDFLGSGGSDGNTTSIGYYEAEQVKACYDFAKAKGEKNIYLFGISMGSVAIMKFVKDNHPDLKGIILECPFGNFKTTVKKRFKNFGIPTFPMADLLMLWGSYQSGYWIYGHNPVDYAKDINCPTLLLYGEWDHAVSRKEIDDMYNNLKGEKTLKVFKRTNHEIYRDLNSKEWVDAIKLFLTETGTYNEPVLNVPQFHVY